MKGEIMGQSYYVDAKFDIRNEKEFVTEGRKIFERSYVRPVKENQKDTVEHLIETLLAKHQNGYSKDGDNYKSQFDASYGWEGLMEDFFISVKGALNKGSYITVYPDSGHWTEKVE